MLERRVRITNQLGLHARAAAKLVRLSARFDAAVTIRFGGSTADAASILDVLTLAVGYGNYVDISADGPDETAALDQIEKLFIDGFGEL
jgi:phosphocarrier protein HPr